MENNLNERIESIEKSFNSKIKESSSLVELDNLRIKYLGRKGIFSELMSNIKSFSIDEKRKFGPLLNKLKKEFEKRIKEKREFLQRQIAEAKINKKRFFDVTSYKFQDIEGHLHPYSKFIREVEDIFISMGFMPAEGPEVEDEFFNFTALNIPKDHPARDMYDTFWLNKSNRLLRTHTSPVQIRTMKKERLPIATFAVGKTYRHEAVDASHDIEFIQCEGMLIDKNINLSNLFAIAKLFLQKLFNKQELDIRIRPGFFPFVEPGVEIDMRCPFCTNGCSVCKKTRWIEVFPGGLIHPNVLRAGGIDPDRYSGFAFGFGLTRLAMLKYGINDIRYFYSGKLKFLNQF